MNRTTWTNQKITSNPYFGQIVFFITGGFFEDAIEADVAEHVGDGIEHVEDLENGVENFKNEVEEEFVSHLDEEATANQAILDSYAYDGYGNE